MRIDRKVTIEDAKKIIEAAEKGLSDEQVKEILDFLYKLAEIEYLEYQNQRDQNNI